MENLIEKIKGLDKKVLIGAGIGAAALIILIIVLVIGLGNKPTGNQGDLQPGTQAGTETEAGTEIVGTEDVTEEIVTEIATETEIPTETQTTESESQSENKGNNKNEGQSQGIGGTTVTQRPSVDGVEQKPITTTPDGEEILGEGSADTPFEVIPDLDTMTVTTIQIPAGKTVYYKIQRVGGMYLTINDANAYVIEANGTRHNPSGGKVAFTLESALASDYISLQIGNNGSAAKSFTLKFSNIKGTYQNPEKITEVGTFEKKLSSGNEIGYYYKYTAQQTGKLKFYITGTKPSGISVTNNSTSANRTTDADTVTDESGRQCVELEVTAGDEILILIHAQTDSKGRYPATNITWEMKY